MELIHSFDADGYYTGSAERPWDPVQEAGALINEAVATLDPVPVFEPQTERARRVDGAWTVEAILLPEPNLEPEQALPPVWPKFFGNAKLDLFTRDEQLAVVMATMSDPVVKLMYDRLLGAAYWSYEDPETEEGLSFLVSKDLLTVERKAEIVAAMQPKS